MNMKLTVALLLVLTTTALADNAPLPTSKPAADKKQPTVAELVTAGAALKQLKEFHFSGDTLMDMAVDLQQAEQVQRSYTEAYNALIKQTYGSLEAYSTLQLQMQAEAKKVDKGELDPAARTVDAKREAFQAEADKQVSAPASALLVPIRREALCLKRISDDVCPQANAIPVDVLRALLPLMEVGR